MTAPLTVTTRRATDHDELDHLVCCDPHVALCGADLTDVPWADDLPNLCRVCEDLDDYECERCGE